VEAGCYYQLPVHLIHFALSAFTRIREAVETTAELQRDNTSLYDQEIKSSKVKMF